MSLSILESNLVGQVFVNKSMSHIKRTDFDAMGLNLCVVYEMMLLRRSNQDFKELATVEFDNPRWDTWTAPTILENNRSSSSITVEKFDNETNGGYHVRHYYFSCTGGDTANYKGILFYPNKELKLENLFPETWYIC